MEDFSIIPNLSRRVARLRTDGYSAAMLRGQSYERPHHGLRRPANAEAGGGPALRVADAIGLMTDGCALTGWAARWIQRQAYCEGIAFGDERPVTILCGPGSHLRPRPGLRPCERRYLPGETVDLGGFRAATMARAAYDDMLDARTPTDALVEVEMAVSTVIDQARTALSNVRAVFDSHVKTRGRATARWALAHACTRSATPWETRTRMLATEAIGIERWIVNMPVFDLRGNLLGVPDLLDPRTGLVLESDGAGHREEDAHNADNVREELFEEQGLTVVRIGAKQHSADQRAQSMSRIQAAADRAARTGAQRWTIDKPAWWWEWDPGRRWD